MTQKTNELAEDVEKYLNNKLKLLQQGCDESLKKHAEELSEQRTNHFWQIFKDQTEKLEQNILRLKEMYNESIKNTRERNLPESLEKRFEEATQERFENSIKSSVRFFKKNMRLAAKTLDIDTKIVQKALDQIKIEPENILK